MRSFRPLLPVLLLFLAAAPASASSCDPRSADEWAARSLVEGAEVEDLLDDVRQFPALRHLGSLGDARELLALARFSGECRQALRELLAAALNLASGRLHGDCCLAHEGEGARTIREALQRAADDCHAGRNCEEALRFLRRVNDAGRVHDCGDHDPDRDRVRDRDRRRDGEEDGDCCRPRSRGWWHRQCLGADRVHPTRGQGAARGPGAHVQLSEEDRDRAFRRAARRLEGCRVDACEALDSKNLGGKQAKAEAEVAALALNWGAGYLDGCRGGEAALDEAVRALRSERWDDAWRLAHDANQASGRGMRRCDDDPEDHDEDADGDRDDDDRGGKPKGKGKGKGKKK